MTLNVNFKRVEWEWDNFASMDYNIVAKFEETLINFEIIEDFSDITATEDFVLKVNNLKIKEQLIWANIHMK